MKYLKSILIIVLLYTTSCSGKLIPEEKMAQIIADIYKADRYVNSEYKLVLAADTTRIYEAVFNHYGYTSEEFIYTIEHFLSRPSKLKAMYSKAKIMVTEQDSILSEIIAYGQKLDSFAVPYNKLMKNVDSVMVLVPRQRALRWIMEPSVYPRWSLVHNDSIKKLYETPQMNVWWLNNFKKDSTNLNFTFIDEKNSRTVRVPPKFNSTHLERASYPQ